MFNERLGVFVTVISAGRPGAVEKMVQFTGSKATWIVPYKDVNAYRAAGAHVVGGGNLMSSRNLALELAFNEELPCLQLSDDLKRLQKAVEHPETKKTIAVAMTMRQAVKQMVESLESSGARLAGVAPTANPFYAAVGKVKERAFVVGDMMVVLPSEPRFDAELKLKEDYDFTCQHVEMYGKVARCDDILATFIHRTNAGGAVSYRTSELEQAAMARIVEKWGKWVRPHPKRADEIVLRFGKEEVV